MLDGRRLLERLLGERLLLQRLVLELMCLQLLMLLSRRCLLQLLSCSRGGGSGSGIRVVLRCHGRANRSVAHLGGGSLGRCQAGNAQI